MLFRGFGCKIQTKGPSRNADTVLTMNIVKYENVIICAIKRNTSNLELRKKKTKVGKQGVRFLYLFEIASGIQVYGFTSQNNRDMLHQPKTPLKLNSNFKIFEKRIYADRVFVLVCLCPTRLRLFVSTASKKEKPTG